MIFESDLMFVYVFTESLSLLRLLREKFADNLRKSAKLYAIFIQIMTMKLLKNQNKAEFTELILSQAFLQKLKTEFFPSCIT